MYSPTRFIRTAAFAVLTIGFAGFASSPVSAQIGAFHHAHQDNFMASLETGYLTPDFPDGLIEGSLELSAPGNAYAAVTGSMRGLWGDSGILTTNYDDEVITLTFTTGNVRAFGGEFYQNDLYMDLMDPIPISVTTAKGRSATILASLGAPFGGFLLYDPTDYFVTATIGNPQQLEPDRMWPMARNFFFGGNASAAPEPGALALALPILAGAVLARHRGRRGR